MVNACLDRLRRTRNQATVPLTGDRIDRVNAADPIVSSERHRLVADALATLNPDQRAALILVDMEGFPVEQAAQILGCAVGTVKSRCARSRARLVPLLADLRDREAGAS